MKTRIFHLHALSALHIGTGQGVGTVDLPIARSRATNLPLVPGSSLKGVLRDSAKTQWKLVDNDINALFGSENTVDETHASAVAFGDAHLLLLPVRSFAGTVAYATCPFILQRYARDMKLKHKQVQLKDNTAALCTDSELLIKNTKIALEDLDMDAAADENAQEWAKTIADALYPDSVDDAEKWREQFTKRFVVLPDNVFSFLADTATEIRMRIRIDSEKRIVKQGALWS
ncbi:type III-B CRISPR module RAMP protein Cmr4, partial [Conchiformibius steedae]|uniref:type III-B CRISPR module RAMP protein Cmr4 n=1 Tax=Conchiformibius steedae TaxID=153493 RepID=UPI0026F1C38A